ncbi:MAG: Coenzyme F420 hydrogenase/dehydrogenase, beta subunit C-terminal domain [Raoultibacter sp.]
MNLISEHDKCCGCQACGDACTQKAISFKLDRGFLYPCIDQSKCVECGRCVKICPVTRHVDNDEYDDYSATAYAAWNTNDDDIRNSTSGGAFIALARYCFDMGWYVAGCVFSEDYKSCSHIVTNNLSDLDKLVHSKYFQSNMCGVYQNIKTILQAGKNVLFCGTPCQAAALYSFLEGVDRSKLILVDLICKGIPSPLVHQKFVSLLEKKRKCKVVYFRPKSKVHGWGKMLTEVKYENGKREYIRSPLDTLFVTQALNVRTSCASCSYKGYDRASDLSIGDYWGITGVDERIKAKGVSAVVANTQKGYDTLIGLKDRMEIRESTVFDISNFHNPGYGKTIILNQDHDAFFFDVDEKPFEFVLKKYAVNNSAIAIALRKLKWAWSKIVKISIPKFIYLNFLSKHIKRGKHALIIPGYHTCFGFGKGSMLIIEHGNALINIKKPKGSREEAWIELGENAKMLIHHGLDMRNSRIGVQKDATLEIGDLEMNGRCNFMARQSIQIGDGVMIARNVTIYDSDYHPFSIGDNVQSVATKPVVIGNNVWIGNGATIMKGVSIGYGAVVGTQAFVVKRVKPRTMVSGNPANEVCKDVYWSKGH